MFKDIFLFLIVSTLVMLILYLVVTSVFLVIKNIKKIKMAKNKQATKEANLGDCSEKYLNETIFILSNPNLKLDKDWDYIIEQLKGLHYVSKICKEDEKITFYKYQNIFKEILVTVKHAITLQTYNKVDLINTVMVSLELPVEEILNGDVTTRIISDLKNETKIMEDIKARRS